MREISIKDFDHIKIGHAQDLQAATGCSVLLFENGATAGVDVRGGGPASRETQLLSPLASAQDIHAILLSGGSAFGLDAAGGVMRYLEEKKIGFDTGIAKVPLVCTSCIFDLGIGSSDVRPDAQMAYEACINAKRETAQGNVGVGTGATVGKYRGGRYMMKSGFGAYALESGGLKVGAVVAVNALGDIRDKDGRIIAGMLREDGRGFADTQKEMLENGGKHEQPQNVNTTIGVVFTNASFRKAQLCKIAGMTHNGYARAICPVHTMADGDSVYAVSLGDFEADINVVGTFCAYVMEEAIRRAVIHAQPAYGIPSAKSLEIFR